MVELEIAYLFEIGKVSYPPNVVLEDLAPLDLSVSASPFSSVVRVAIGLRWTRDPFDRLIAAQAVADGVPLLTADRRIRAHLDLAVWDLTGESDRRADSGRTSRRCQWVSQSAAGESSR